MRTVLSFGDNEEFGAKVAANSMELNNALEDINEVCRNVIDGKNRLDATELAEEIKSIATAVLTKL